MNAAIKEVDDLTDQGIDTAVDVIPTLENIPFTLLVEAPENCRTYRPECIENESVDEQTTYTAKGDVESLAQSLLEEGQLVNLIVYRIQNEGKEQDYYAVVDGETRRQAMGLLIEQGKVDSKTTMICSVHSKQNAVRLSWIANAKRRKLSLCDKFLGYKRLSESGLSISQIASTEDVPESEVKKILRLSDLHPAIFEQLRDGNIDLSVACKYASTTCKERQFSVFTQLKSDGYEGNSYHVGQLLSQQHVKGHSAVARFVGEQAYSAAGGLIERDLFSTDDTSQWMNPEIAYDLANRKLDHKAQVFRTSWSWVVVHLEHEQPELDVVKRFLPTFDENDVPVEVMEPFTALEAEISSVQSQMSELELRLDEQDEDIWDSDDYRELDDRLDELNDRHTDMHTTIHNQYGKYTDIERQFSGVVITYSRLGDLEVRCGFLLKGDLAAYRKATQSNTESGSDSEVHCHDHNSIQDDLNKPKTNSSLDRDLSVAKRSILRAHLTRSANVSVARDLMEYSICRRALEPYYAAITFLSTSMSSVNDPCPEGSESYILSHTEIETIKQSLPMEWMSNDPTEQECLEAFIALPAKKRDALVAYSVASSLVLGSEYHMTTALPESLISRMDINAASMWRPDRSGYFKRLKSDELYDLGLRWYGTDSEFAKQHSKSKKSERLDAICRVFEDDVSQLSNVEQMIRESWLPEQVHI